VSIRDCVGCGYCCKEAVCTLGLLLNPSYVSENGDCPELFWSEQEKKYRCKAAEGFGERLYIGAGCCSPLNTWRKDVRRREDE